MLLHTETHTQLPRRTNQRESSAKQLTVHLESNLACSELAQVSLHGTAWSHLNELKVNRMGPQGKKGNNTLTSATFLKLIILTWQRNYFQCGTWYNVSNMTNINTTIFFKELLFVCFLSWIYVTYTAHSFCWWIIQTWDLSPNTKFSDPLGFEHKRLAAYSHEKPTLIRILLYYKTSGSRVLNPSSDIHNSIVQKIYYLYKKELYL